VVAAARLVGIEHGRSRDIRVRLVECHGAS
jgi:hypothetical protein